MKKRIYLNLILFAFAFLLVPFFVSAQSIGEGTSFFVDSGFSKTNQSSVDASLRFSSNLLNIYIEDSWWEERTDEEKREMSIILNDLGNEFDSRMFNQLTYSYGSLLGTGDFYNRKESNSSFS